MSRLPRTFRSPPRAQPARRPVRRGKPQNVPRGGVPALDAKRKGCLRVRPSLRVPFPTRRSGGNAEVPASASRRPAGWAGLVYGPFWPIPPPAPHGSFHQNLRIFFLRFQHFIFILSPSRTEYSPSLASLGSPLSEGAGRAADATGERRPSRAIRRPPRTFRSPPRAQSARRPACRGKPQNGPRGGVSALDAKRKRLPPRSAKPPRSFSNAEIRRQRGGARIRFAPLGRKGRSRIRPVLADSAAVPRGQTAIQDSRPCAASHGPTRSAGSPITLV